MTAHARHPRRILILGAFGTGNLGDELILDATIRLLSRAYPGCEARAFSYDPIRSGGLHAIDFAPTPPFTTPRHLLSTLARSPLAGAREYASRRRRTQDLIEWCDLFVLGGGNLLTDGDFYFLEHFVGQIVSRAHSAGKPIALVGTGFGPVRTGRGRRLLSELGGWVGAATFREATGASAFRDLGFAGAVAVGDPVLLAPPPLEGGHPAPSRGPVAVSLRPVDGLESMPSHVAGAIDMLRERMGVVGLAMHPEQDMPVLERQLGSRAVVPHDTLAGLASAVASSSAVLGMRLHACILGAVYQRPVIAVPYHDKVEMLATSLDLPVLPLRGSFSQEDLEKRVHLALETNRSEAVRRARREGLRALWAALSELPFDPPVPLETATGDPE